MKNFFPDLVLFSLLLISNVYSFGTFNSVLQNYRQSYLDIKGSSMKTLDKSFFDVYNQLASYISSIHDGYATYVPYLNVTCNGFNSTNLKTGSTERLTNFCESINTITTYTLTELDDVIMTFYYGTLSADTEPMKIADYIWEYGDDNLDSLLSLYLKSPKCMQSQMGSYLDIYKNYVNIIIKASSVANRNMTNLFSKMISERKNIGLYMMQMGNSLKNCSTMKNSTQCVGKFVS